MSLTERLQVNQTGAHLHSLPAPLPVFGVVGESPHVHVGLDDLWAEDEVLLVLARGDGLDPPVETKRFWTQLQGCREHERNGKIAYFPWIL